MYSTACSVVVAVVIVIWCNYE